MTNPAGHGTDTDVATHDSFLAEALASVRARGAADGLVAVTVPAPSGDAAMLWAAGLYDDAWYWRDAAGSGAESAIGSVAGATEGTTEARGAIQDAWRDAQCWSHPRVASGPALRAVGGMCFDPDTPADSVWHSFGKARFFLPRWRFVSGPDGATLTVCVLRRNLDAAAVEQVVGEYRRLELALRTAGWPDGAERAELLATELSLDAWRELVQAAREAIRSGQLSKVVAARRTLLRAPQRIDPARALAALRRSQPGTTVFGLRFGHAAFVGASPETLVERQGLRVRTEALAGTTARGSQDDHRLLESTKDRLEQSIVVQEIAQRLRAVCSRLDVPSRPALHQLRHVTHLRTPIEGELLAALHVLDIVALLHPTPAVAGLPRRLAMQWIAEHEPASRGWYAGPVGWFDQQGDGRFIVALRSALVVGNDAHAYAGAGIVGASEPEAEYAETHWKLAAIRTALGADDHREAS